MVHRGTLRAAGISRDEERSEVRAGRWTVLGRHTIYPGPPTADGLTDPSAAWRWHRPTAWLARAAWAVWESGSGAMLDGTSALIAAGLTHFDDQLIHVTVPRRARIRELPGVRVHRPRQAEAARTWPLPSVTPECATVNAARWAQSHRQAALLLVMPVQQRLTTGERVLQEWSRRRGAARSADRRNLAAGRRNRHATAGARTGEPAGESTDGPARPGARAALIGAVLRDVTGGVEALGELDFARLCRAYRVPEPTRQAIRRGHRGRIFLDVQWDEHRAGAEIDGGQHGMGLKRVDDSLRDNELVIAQNPVLRIPIVGLRTDAPMFMGQVRRLLASRPPSGSQADAAAAAS